MLTPASLVRNQCGDIRGKRLPLLRGLTLIVVTCLCLSSQLLPQDGQPPQLRPQTQVTCLHHEQTVAVVSLDPRNIITRCRLILAEASDKFDKVQLLQHLARKMPVEKISFKDMLDVISACRELEGNVQSTEYEKEEVEINLATLTKGILPGTLWCGVDDIAGDYHNLGALWRLDKCCRAHDFCPVKVKPFQTRYNLFNFAPYTKSHCDCDEAFYNCLKAANTSKADAVGDVFFNVLGIQCVEEKLGRGCPQNYNAETREENPDSRSLILPGLAVRINKSPSAQSGADCENPRLFVINTKRKY